MVDFESAVDVARSLEKKALSYSTYDEKVEIREELDLSPKDYEDYTYRDLLNLYDRAEKIIKASGLELARPAAAPATKKAEARKKEVESKVKEITGEALKSAEEIGKELEKPVEAKPEAVPEAPAEEIEFERLGPEEFEEEKPEIELEREEAPEIELAKEIEIEEQKPEIEIEKPPEIEKEEKPPEAKPEEEKPQEVVPEAKPEVKPPKPKKVVPPVLRERAEKAGERKYSEIEQQIMATLGEKVDEKSLKKKMLELTKELFKEKSVSRRERIKLEITVLKNMLKGKVRAPKKGKEQEEAKDRILDTLISTQKKELATTKDKLLTDYKHMVDEHYSKYQDKLSELAEDDQAGRKAAYEKMVFELTKLGEQLPQAVLKYQSYMKDKHEAEMRKLRSGLGKKEAKLVKKAEGRIKDIDKEYAKEFSTARAIIKKQMDIAIESGSRAAFKEEKVSKAKAKVQDLVREINDMDEGTLLYFLHGNDPDFYKKYERKHLSKQEAIFRAKALMAKEKGLSDDMVKKYFSESEG